MILLLAGTAEARQVAAGLVTAGLPAMASLAGATRDPRPLALPCRIGGFGGAAAQGDWMRQQGVRAVIDASHPFAARIGPRTAGLCAELSLPYLRLLRPGWTQARGDRWTRLPDAAAVASAIPAGATVFLTTGRQTAADFAGLAGCRLYCRVIDPPLAPFPVPGGEWLVGRPPFTVADEVETLRRLGVDWLVVKDSGGAGGRAKLDAARVLGLPVAMLDRPKAVGPVVATVAEALVWAREPVA